MAIDEALLRRADEDPDPRTTIRLYRWDRPTVSLGYAQQPSTAADLAYCRRQGIPVVRRPTGGRAVLHAEELTYALASNDLQLFGGHGIGETYLTIARILQQALVRMGCTAEVSPGAASRRRASGPSSRVDPCFVSTSRYEITAGGRKLIGSAQRRLKRAFLQHGSILLQCNYEAHARALGANPALLAESFTDVRSCLTGEEALIETRLRRAIPESLEATLHTRVVEAELDQEESLAALHYQRLGRHRVEAADHPDR